MPPETTPQAPCGDRLLRKLTDQDDHCDLCGEPCSFDSAVYEAGAMNICPECLEGLINAPAYDARAEVGMVGSGGGRS